MHTHLSPIALIRAIASHHAYPSTIYVCILINCTQPLKRLHIYTTVYKWLKQKLVLKWKYMLDWVKQTSTQFQDIYCTQNDFKLQYKNNNKLTETAQLGTDYNTLQTYASSGFCFSFRVATRTDVCLHDNMGLTTTIIAKWGLKWKRSSI